MTNHRSAITGQYVTAEHAKNNPDTTVSESRDDLAAELRRLRGVNHNLQVALYGANVKIVELEANLDHLRTEDIPVIQQRRDELIARVAELEAAPTVRTVGDLTARHQLACPRLRVAGREGRLKIVKPSEVYRGKLAITWGHWWDVVSPEEPCEVLG